MLSLDAGHRLALRPTLDPTTSWALEEWAALVVEAAVGEEAEEVVAFLLVAPLSSICSRTSVHPCIPGQDLPPCCLQEEWGVQEEVGLLILVLACPHSSSTDRAGTRSTAHHCLEVEVHEGPCLPWEEAWDLE